ncbi:MAG: L-Ala-D/L-Glu epimerase [Rhodospirillales bacterium]|nr:L-Ala-D/L-Glu epimerase [Rhodospirillales bacterium]
MTRTLRVRAETWPLRRPFAIARGLKTAAEVVVAEIEEDGRVGRGECVPYGRYGETVGGVVAALEDCTAAVAAGLTVEALQANLPAGAARNALDCALWDLVAKKAGRRAWDLAGLAAPAPVRTAETISLAEPEAMAAAAAGIAAAADAPPLLKIKLGADEVAERVAAVRAAAPGARLIVDANEGWTLAALERLVRPLEDLGVEMIEQPLPAGQDTDLAGLSSPIILCADESCHGVADLDRLAGYGMVNVKLDKTGGLTGALELVAAARARGLAVMIGCMVATSLAMAPATLLTAGAEIVDLDGPLWLSRDRDPSLRYAEGRVYPPPPSLWG